MNAHNKFVDVSVRAVINDVSLHYELNIFISAIKPLILCAVVLLDLPLSNGFLIIFSCMNTFRRRSSTLERVSCQILCESYTLLYHCIFSVELGLCLGWKGQ